MVDDGAAAVAAAMFRRKSSAPDSLPLTGTGGNDSPSAFGFRRNSTPDGSSRSIKLDAPVVQAWKHSSTFTKYSYYAVIFFLVMVYGGYRSLRFWNCKKKRCGVARGVTIMELWAFPFS